MDTRQGKALLISAILLLAVVPCAAARTLLDSIRSLGLPVMCIETVNFEEPTCDYVGAPTGSIGAGITNCTKVPMCMTMYRASDAEVLYDSGEYVEDESGATIKLRGNTSAYENKKPYKIKLQKKADLLMRGDKKYKDKNWILIADDELMTTFGTIVAEIVRMEWVPQGMYVNVIFNGDYRGMYYLMEQVKRNNDCRLATDKSGFIMELDPYWWLEPDCYIRSLLYHPLYSWTYKYPEPEDVTPEQTAYIKSYLNAAERSLADATFPDYIDVSTMANWFMGHDLLGTLDSGGTNKYVLKRDDSDTTKLVMPLLWDFDSAMQTPNTWGQVHNSSRGRRYFSSDNKQMVCYYQRRWKYLAPIVKDLVMSRFDEFINSEQGQGYALSRAADDVRWSVTHTSVADARSRLYDWMKKRVVFMNNFVPRIYTNPFADGDVNEDGTIDGIDVNIAISHILGTGVAPFAADCNGDGVIDAADLNIIIDGALNAR